MVSEPASRFTLESGTVGPKTQVLRAGGVIGGAEGPANRGGSDRGSAAGPHVDPAGLAGVTGVGPGLLGALLRIRRGATRVGGRLALLASAPPVAELVNTSLLALLIDVASDSDHALRLISEGWTSRDVAV